MKGFQLSARRAPEPNVPQVSVDVVPSLPSVQGAIALAEAQNKKKAAGGLDYGDDVGAIIKAAGPMLAQAIPGVSAAMEALMGSLQSQETGAAKSGSGGTSMFGMSRQGVKG